MSKSQEYGPRTSTATCEDVLLLLSLEEPSEEQEGTIDEHLAGCDICRDTVAWFCDEDLTPYVDGEPATSPFDAAAIAGIRDSVPFAPTLPMGQARTTAPAQQSDKRSTGSTHGERYVVLEFVAAGGMGEVYAAYDRHLERKVALKILEPSWEKRYGRARERLFNEARALAQIAHNNVVRIYDYGEMDGQMFLAMEYVDGQTLSAWTREQGGPERWRRVLDKFLDAGAGLAAIHEEGLVHRDFKPDNVLVGSDGRAVLIDFGLASRSSGSGGHGEDAESAAAKPRLTGHGERMGTPLYMAPEQFENSQVDSRSDQFSFCVALYEALYQQMPFPGEDLREQFASGGTPVRPLRLKSPKALWKVISRGLSIDPAQRFPSMDALLGALRRARRPRWQYATAGTVAAAAAASVLGVLMPLGGGTAAAPCAIDSISKSAWDPSTQERLGAVFQGSGVAFADKSWTTTRHALDVHVEELAVEERALCVLEQGDAVDGRELTRRENCLHHDIQGLQALLGVLQQGDGRTVENAARLLAFAESDTCYQGFDFNDVRDEVARELADIEEQLIRVRLEILAGNIDTAQRMARSLWSRVQQTNHVPMRAAVLVQLGKAESRTGVDTDLATARQHLIEAAILATHSGYHHIAFESYNELVTIARLHRDQVPMAQAFEWSDKALAESAYTDQPALLRADGLRNRGVLYFQQARYAEAEADQREALALALEHGAHPLDRASILHDLGNTLIEGEKYDEAQALFEEALALKTEKLGELHPRLANTSYDHGIFMLQAGRYEDALAWLGKSEAIWTSLYGPAHRDVASSLLLMAYASAELGHFAQADEYLAAGLTIYDQILDEGDRAWGEAYTIRGAVQYRKGEVEDALAWFTRALDVYQSPSLHRTGAHLDMGLAQVRLDRYADARQSFDMAERGLSGMASPPARYLGLLHMGRGLLSLGERAHGDAAARLETAREALDREPGMAIEKAEIAWALARAYRATGRDEDARPLATEARRVFALHGQQQEVAAIDEWLVR